MNFTNKVVWITGASSGIGKALALKLSEQHVKLILSSRRVDSLEAIKNECKTSKNIKILPLDLEKHDTLSSTVTIALNLFGTIDILVNNGGISQRSFARDTLFEVDKKILDINYLGTIALSKSLLHHFEEKNSYSKLNKMCENRGHSHSVSVAFYSS